MITFVQDPINESTRPYDQSKSTLNKDANHEYICERIFKDKSQLCRIAIPYTFQQEDLNKQIKKDQKKKLKPTKRIPKYDLPYKNNKPFKPFVDHQKTPINQYLSYDLSEEINLGLKQVKVISQQIKHIKEEKKKQVNQTEVKKINKHIRIRPTKPTHKLFHSSSPTFFR